MEDFLFNFDDDDYYAFRRLDDETTPRKKILLLLFCDVIICMEPLKRSNGSNSRFYEVLYSYLVLVLRYFTVSTTYFVVLELLLY